LAKTAKELKLKGLLLPKTLDLMSLEKTLAMKTRLEGIISIFEEQSLERREPIPNSLKIIKVLMKSLAAVEPQVLRIGNLSCWESGDFLQDDDTRAFAEPRGPTVTKPVQPETKAEKKTLPIEKILEGYKMVGAKSSFVPPKKLENRGALGDLWIYTSGSNSLSNIDSQGIG
jgi:hypothetical protein